FEFAPPPEELAGALGVQSDLARALTNDVLERPVALSAQALLRRGMPPQTERPIPRHVGPERPRVQERGEQVEPDRRIRHPISLSAQATTPQIEGRPEHGAVHLAHARPSAS